MEEALQLVSVGEKENSLVRAEEAEQEVSQKDSNDNNIVKLVCQECGKKFNTITGTSNHVARQHKISVKEYYDKYFKKENEGQCIECKKETSFYNLKIGYNKFCNNFCSNKSEASKQKQRQTNKKRYNTDHPMKNKRFYNNFISVMKERYGKENPSQVEEFQIKKEQTNLKNWQVKNPFQNKEIQKRYNETSLKKYNTKWPMQNKEIQKILKDSVFKKYNVDYIFQVNEIKSKIEQIMLKKYKFKNAIQNPVIYKKMLQTMLNRYGETHYAKTEKGRKICRETHFKMVNEQLSHNESAMPCIGKNERSYLNFLEKITNNYIERIPNIDGFFPDGRILHLNLLIEFDEPHHFLNNKLREKDLNREKFLISQGYTIFRIKQTNWKQNKDKVINDFKILIEVLQGECHGK